MFRIANDAVVICLEYLEIYDIFAFMRTNKKYFLNLQIERLFISYYENADMLFVALCDNCKEPNKRMLFLDLCTDKRSFKNMVFEKLLNDKDIELTNKLLSIKRSYDNRVKGSKQFMNQPEKFLKNIHWIWEDISLKYKRKEPLSEEYKKQIKTLLKKEESILRETGVNIEDPNYSSFIKEESYNYEVLNINDIVTLRNNAYVTAEGKVMLASYSSPIEILNDKYISIMVNGRKGRIPIIFDD